MATIQRTKNEHAQSLANYLPGGKLFKVKNYNNSNFRKLLNGIACELFTADGYLRDYQQEVIPDQTVLFLDEWEKALGIPDDCFPGTGTLSDRRTHILVKLASLGIQTAQDFVDLAALFGITVSVTPAYDHTVFPFEFPILLLSTTDAMYTIVITFTVTINNEFPLTFPITFGDPIIGILECLFGKLKPANCNLLFVQV